MNQLKFVIISLFLLLGGYAGAQSRQVSGTVEDNNGTAIEGAYVTYSKGGKTVGCKTNRQGQFSMVVTVVDTVAIKFSHLNYKDTVIVLRKNDPVKTMKVVMKRKMQSLEGVTIKAESPNGNLKGDTTVYYATAYKTHKDATAYDLIQKLPGVGVGSDGSVQAHGETVSEVLIDGKEYDNINMALKNLPAYVINEVQIYYKGSDYSRLTGFDDGDREMVLNFSTKQPENEKLMGRIQSGYGYDGRYDFYGNLNWFKDKHSVSLFGQLNNVNKQDFSGFSLLEQSTGNTPGESPYSKGRSNRSNSMEGGENERADLSDGITTTTAAGLNYTYQPKDSSVSITVHYMYNKSKKDLEYNITDMFFFDSMSENQRQESTNNTESHRLKSKIEWNITPKDVVVFRPELSIQNSEKDEFVTVSRNTSLGLAGSTTGQTSMNQKSNNIETALMGIGSLTYIHRIGERGAALSLDLKGGHLTDGGDMKMTIRQSDTSTSIARNISDKGGNDQLDAVLSFATPSINRYSRLKFDIGYSLKSRRNDIFTEQGDTLGAMVTDTMSSGSVSVSDKGVTGRLIYMYSRHSLNMVGGLELTGQAHDIHSMRITHDTNYLSFLPFLQLRYTVNPMNQLHVNIVSRQVLPSTNMLQEAATVVNPTLCVVGNAMLQPSYNHDLSVRWLYNDVARSRFMVLFAKYEMVDNYLATVRNITNTSEGNGMQMVTFRNSEEAEQSFEALGAYGFPVRLIKSNVNLSSFLRLSHVPGYYDNQLSSSEVTCWNNSMTIGSNISERLDFVIDLNMSYYSDENNYSKEYTASYWSYSFGGQLVKRIGRHIKGTLECGYTGYAGEWVSKYNAVICNMSLSAMMGKNENWELQLAVNDIFNQNNNFYQSTTELYLRKTETNVLKRYFMAKLIYKFNKKTTNE